MVKKRAVLSGQGKKLFFSEEKEKKAPPAKKKASVPDESRPKKQKSAPDLVKKIRLLKDLVGEFKKFADPKAFKEMRASDLKSYTTPIK